MPFIDTWRPALLTRQNAFIVESEEDDDSTYRSSSSSFDDETDLSIIANTTAPAQREVSDFIRTLRETSTFYQSFFDDDYEYRNRAFARQRLVLRGLISRRQRQRDEVDESDDIEVDESDEDESQHDSTGSIDDYNPTTMDRETACLIDLHSLFTSALDKGRTAIRLQNLINNNGNLANNNRSDSTNSDKKNHQVLMNKINATLALLALITRKYSQCSDQYLQQFLDPNGNYDRKLALVAAAAYDGILYIDEQDHESKKSCQELITVAEELHGHDWLNDLYDTDKDDSEDSFKKMHENLNFIAKARFRLKEMNQPIIAR